MIQNEIIYLNIFQWSCPAIEISQTEVDVWSDLRHGSLDIASATKALADARDSGALLSSRSAELLAIETEAGRIKFVEEMKDVNYSQQTLITCMEVLKKDGEEADALCLLVVGTEAGHVYVLPQDVNGNSFLCKVNLPSPPVLMTVSGLFDVEWRVSVTCRDGKLYNIKNGDVRGSAILSGTISDLGSQPVSIARQEKLLWVATMDKTVACYTVRGKKTKTLVMPEDVVEIATLPVKRAKVSHLLIVALANGEIRLYREGLMIHSLMVERPVMAIRVGPYGREDNSFAIVHGKGSLTIKMWRRTADVDSSSNVAGPPPEQDIPLPVPKKTKLYVEQTQREREQAPAMHRAFQRDLCKLRLETARAYVKTLTDGQMVSCHPPLPLTALAHFLSPSRTTNTTLGLV